MVVTHVPVLYKEVLELLAPRPSGTYLDCTVNGGGHAYGILERSAPDGRLLGIDADPSVLPLASQRLAPFQHRFVLVHANFRDVGTVAPAHSFPQADGILFDLGLSTLELEASGRGFTFREDQPLDMRFDPTRGPTAADLLQRATEEELAKIIAEYGEDYRAHRIARAIVTARRHRPIRTTFQLLEAIAPVLGPWRGRIHPATRVFQALRIAVNDELEALKSGLEAAVRLLTHGGRIVVISFHSLEDRIVKRFYLSQAEQGVLAILTRKPVTPSRQETLANPRARSAKLRAAEKLGGTTWL